MPVTLYTRDEVEIYTRLLARAYDMIREEPATDASKYNFLNEIEKTLGWGGPPPMKARPPREPAFDEELEMAKIAEECSPLR